MAYDYLNKTGLTNLWAKIKEKFVLKEHKTGSSSEYKVLSDNNLTDDLKQKILNAGDSTFDGQYTSLTGKPSIEGHELASGNQTAASLGLATPSDVSTATADMATQAWVNGKGYQTSAQVQQAVTTATDDMATQTWVTGRGYATTSALTSATADMATKTWVTSQKYATTSSVNSLISAAVAGAYKAKGSVAFASLPAIATATVGDVYNVTNQFSTTGDFMEGAGKTYSAGTNVVCVDAGSGTKKWDVLAGFVDLAGYVAKTDLVAITETEIDEICV